MLVDVTHPVAFAANRGLADARATSGTAVRPIVKRRVLERLPPKDSAGQSHEGGGRPAVLDHRRPKPGRAGPTTASMAAPKYVRGQADGSGGGTPTGRSRNLNHQSDD
jgi:hypothetical protein